MYGINHPLVLSGSAFWINDKHLCIGYTFDDNPEIYRPIFSHKRQRLLNKITKDILNPKIFWNNIRTKYFNFLYKIRNLPVTLIECIILFCC